MEQNNLNIKLAAPAQRALSNAGIKTLKQLASFTEKEISELHGIGKNALTAIKKTLSENKLTFKK